MKDLTGIDFALAGSMTRDYLKTVQKDPTLAVSEKINGFREMWFIGEDENELLNKSLASHLSVVPQFQIPVPELDGTILDCEGVSARGIGSKHAKSIFGSYPDHAIAHQKIYGNGQLIAFDILRYKGEDVMHLPFDERHRLLQFTCTELWKKGFNDLKIENFAFGDLDVFFDEVIAKGGEGVMVKNLKAPYSPGRSNNWIKIKKRIAVDYIITGFTPGQGKYHNTIGAIMYGAKRDGVIVPLGKSSGMTDIQRYHMGDHPEMYIGRVAEFEAHDMNPETGVLIHPTFVRLRDESDLSKE